MKKLLLITSISIFLFSCSKNRVELKELTVDNNTATTYHEGELFSGVGFKSIKDRLREEIHYKNGQQHGAYTRWARYGSKPVSEGFYVNGKEDGTWIKRTPGGVLQIESEWENGKKNGRYTLYYGNGQIQETGLYTNDKEEGWWEYYHAHDGLIKEVYYENGEYQLSSEEEEFELR